MIQIQRSRCPPILKNKGKGPDAYRSKVVVRTLWQMQHGKCCYCEQLIPQEGHAKAVEHFRPKSVFKSRRNDWSNLLLACSQCNGSKSDKFPIMLTDRENEPKVVYLKRPKKGDPVIIDPSNMKTDPEGYLDYHLDVRDGALAGQILPRNSSSLGKITIEVTGIDQAFIHRRRHLHWLALMRAVVSLAEAREAGGDANLQAARLHLQNLMSSQYEFAGLARAFARRMGLDGNYGVVIPASGGGA